MDIFVLKLSIPESQLFYKTINNLWIPFFLSNALFFNSVKLSYITLNSYLKLEKMLQVKVSTFS